MHTHQWLTTDTESDFYVPNAIKDKSGSCYDYVYVSLGGNDQMTTGCQESRVDIVKTRIASVLKKVLPRYLGVDVDLNSPSPILLE